MAGRGRALAVFGLLASALVCAAGWSGGELNPPEVRAHALMRSENVCG